MDEGRRLDRLDNVMKTISSLTRRNFKALAFSAASTADRLMSDTNLNGSPTQQAHAFADDLLRRAFESVALRLSAEIAVVSIMHHGCLLFPCDKD